MGRKIRNRFSARDSTLNAGDPRLLLQQTSYSTGFLVNVTCGELNAQSHSVVRVPREDRDEGCSRVSMDHLRDVVYLDGQRMRVLNRHKEWTILPRSQAKSLGVSACIVYGSPLCMRVC